MPRISLYLILVSELTLGVHHYWLASSWTHVTDCNPLNFIVQPVYSCFLPFLKKLSPSHHHNSSKIIKNDLTVTSASFLSILGSTDSHVQFKRSLIWLSSTKGKSFLLQTFPQVPVAYRVGILKIRLVSKDGSKEGLSLFCVLCHQVPCFS